MTIAGVGSEIKELSAAATPTAVEATVMNTKYNALQQSRLHRVGVGEVKVEHAAEEAAKRQDLEKLKCSCRPEENCGSRLETLAKAAQRDQLVEDGRCALVQERGDRACIVDLVGTMSETPIGVNESLGHLSQVGLEPTSWGSKYESVEGRFPKGEQLSR